MSNTSTPETEVKSQTEGSSSPPICYPSRQFDEQSFLERNLRVYLSHALHGLKTGEAGLKKAVKACDYREAANMQDKIRDCTKEVNKWVALLEHYESEFTQDNAQRSHPTKEG